MTNARLHQGGPRYVQPEPTHWFWNEDVPMGRGSLSIEECQRLAIEPHENRLGSNDIPAVLFSATYYMLEVLDETEAKMAAA